MQIWLAMAIKPNLKCTKFGKYKKEYEDKIPLAEANVDRAVPEAMLSPSSLLKRMNWFWLALQSGGSAVQEVNNIYKENIPKS